MTTVSSIVASRYSCRAFLKKPVSDQLLRSLLVKASKAPSGGNLQPWKVYVLSGAKRDELVSRVKSNVENGIMTEGTEYDVYPPAITEPYKTRRKEVGHALYSLLGVPKNDTMSKLRYLARNWEFFDAPVGLIITLDRQMGQGQFVDVGMFLQTFMLLAKEAGLDTCAQEAWAQHYQTVNEVLKLPENEMLFCGVAVGYADEDALINQKREKLASRAAIEEVCTFYTDSKL